MHEHREVKCRGDRAGHPEEAVPTGVGDGQHRLLPSAHATLSASALPPMLSTVMLSPAVGAPVAAGTPSKLNTR